MAKLTREEQLRNQRRRARQMLGIVVLGLMLLGVLTLLNFGAGMVSKLFDDTEQKLEIENNIAGLVLFDPLPFEGRENIQDSTLREAAVWGTVYHILYHTETGLANYERDALTDQVQLPAVEVDAYLAKIFGPDFKFTHTSFEMEGMSLQFDDKLQCYYIPISSFVGSYTPEIATLFKESGRLYATVGYVPLLQKDAVLANQQTQKPTKYMDYVFERTSGEWYLVAVQESEMVAPEPASSLLPQPSIPPLEDFEATVLENLQKEEASSAQADSTLAQGESEDTATDDSTSSEEDASSDSDTQTDE